MIGRGCHNVYQSAIPVFARNSIPLHAFVPDEQMDSLIVKKFPVFFEPEFSFMYLHHPIIHTSRSYISFALVFLLYHN
jgi:hypothetical protein